MSKITAGIVLKTKFIVPNSPLNKSKQYWPNYIKYIDRDEAVRNAHYKEFSLIGNEEERAEEDKERNKNILIIWAIRKKHLAYLQREKQD